MAARLGYTINFRKWMAVLVLLITVGIFGIAEPAYAVWPFDALWPEIAGIILNIASMLVGVTAALIAILLNAAAYNNFINGPGVVVAWTLLRDIANMFFVVVLLVIAFGTILGIDSFHVKKMLKPFLFAAILVNFSRLIIGLMIDAAQVVMMTFVNAISQVGGGNFIQAFQLNDAFRVSQNAPSDGATQIITAIFVLVLIAVATVMIGMFAFMIIVRMVALWILIALSPIAVVLYAVPGGASYFNDWRKKLTANIILGPVLAFFLWLALTMVGDGKIYEQLGNKGSTGEAEQALGNGRPDGIVGSAISSISNFGSFIIAAAIFAFAFKMAQKIAAETGVGVMSSIAKTGTSWAGRAARGFSGYSTVAGMGGRTLKPTFDAAKSIFKEAAPGAAMGRSLERGFLGAAATIAPGKSGELAKERLMELRNKDTQKFSGKYKHLTNDELKENLKQGGPELRAAALELSSRGHRFEPSDAQIILQASGMDEKALDQLKQNMKKSSPELVYDLKTEAGRKAMLEDPAANMENLGPRAFTDEAGRVTDDGRALMDQLMEMKGPKAAAKAIEGIKDRGAKEAALQVIAENVIPPAIRDQDANKARLDGLKRDISSKQLALTTSEQEGHQDAPSVQLRQTLMQDITRMTEEKNKLEVHVDAGATMMEMHTKETGRPDQAVAHIMHADPGQQAILRRKAMSTVLKKVSLNDLKEDAIKNPEVIAGMHEAYGARVGEQVKKLNIDKQKVFNETVGSDAFRQTAPREALEVAIHVTSDVRGITNNDAIQNAVRDMTPQALGQIHGIGGAEEGPVARGLHLRTVADGGRSMKSLPTQKGADPTSLTRLKQLIIGMPAGAVQELKNIINDTNPKNKWRNF